ncbi:MAG TPA: glycoside hydrolase family 130 protein [Daejeonella sp.]|nr:glycoside hydrolase family 130 protein [Daejeonella sp.]
MKSPKLLLPILLIVAVAFGCKTPALKSQPNVSSTSKSVSENWALLSFEKTDDANRILKPGNLSFTDPILNKEVLWERKDVFNPAVVVRNGKIYMLYRAEDTIGKYAGTSRIGLAESSDGLSFNKQATPVLYPDNDPQKIYEWEGGCEDPRVVEDENGTYMMTYTAYDGDKARMMVATSKDLQTWQKHGHVFAKAGERYVSGWSKSGSVVSDYRPDGRIVAAKLNGKYWMFWGDTHLWTATSDDLINWTPVKRAQNDPLPQAIDTAKSMYPELKIALSPRKGKFDSDLVEPGPPAMLTAQGILLIYNSRNILAIGDKSLKEGTYAASQALFSKDDPAKLINRMDRYFMKPDRPYEIEGQVNEVCFLEGLVYFKNKWFLYYGTADSKIAVAVSDAQMKK